MSGRNQATQTVFNWTSSNENVSDYFSRLAEDGPEAVKKEIEEGLDQFVNGYSVSSWFGGGSASMIADWLFSAVDGANWYQIRERLQGKGFKGEMDSITTLAYEALVPIQSQEGEEGKNEIDNDTALRDDFKNKVIDWIEDPDLRRRRFPLRIFCRQVLENAFQAIDWQNLAESLKA